MRIILLEDNASFAKIMMTFLKREGHDVSWYSNSNSLPGEFDELPDMCIFDNDAPQEDAGINALKHIKEYQPGPALLLISGGDGAKEKAKEAEITFLAKPFGLDQLEEAIERINEELAA